MSTAAVRRYTVEEYLTLERDSENKHEFYDGEIFELHRSRGPRATAGATFVHNQIALNIATEFRTRLRGGPCLSFSGDVRVLCPTGFRTYPDAGIVCGPRDLEKIAGTETLKNPTLIVEVLSPSTELYDREVKFRNYQSIPSLNSYLLVSQNHPQVEYFERQPDGRWLLTFADGLGASIELPELKLTLSLADVYADVDFAAEHPRIDPAPPAISADPSRTLP